MKAYRCFVGCPEDSGVILVFAASNGKARSAVKSIFEVEFLEITTRSVDGYDRFGERFNKTTCFLDNYECLAAGIRARFAGCCG